LFVVREGFRGGTMSTHHGTPQGKVSLETEVH
jgi:hypothetical protein